MIQVYTAKDGKYRLLLTICQWKKNLLKLATQMGKTWQFKINNRCKLTKFLLATLTYTILYNLGLREMLKYKLKYSI